MDNIYLPVDNVSDFQCYQIYDSNTIRAYYKNPNTTGTFEYVDFYINSHYLEKEGSLTRTTNSTTINCISSSAITNDFYYRNDFDSILIIVFIISIFIFYIPFKIISRMGGYYFYV